MFPGGVSLNNYLNLFSNRIYIFFVQQAFKDMQKPVLMDEVPLVPGESIKITGKCFPELLHTTPHDISHELLLLQHPNNNL